MRRYMKGGRKRVLRGIEVYQPVIVDIGVLLVAYLAGWPVCFVEDSQYRVYK